MYVYIYEMSVSLLFLLWPRGSGGCGFNYTLEVVMNVGAATSF